MKILCELFGHKISGWQYANPPRYPRYMTARGGVIDGVGRQHIELFAECDRCGKKYHCGNIHGDKEGKIL